MQEDWGRKREERETPVPLHFSSASASALPENLEQAKFSWVIIHTFYSNEFMSLTRLEDTHGTPGDGSVLYQTL